MERSLSSSSVDALRLLMVLWRGAAVAARHAPFGLRERKQCLRQVVVRGFEDPEDV